MPYQLVVHDVIGHVCALSALNEYRKMMPIGMYRNSSTADRRQADQPTAHRRGPYSASNAPSRRAMSR